MYLWHAMIKAVCSCVDYVLRSVTKCYASMLNNVLQKIASNMFKQMVFHKLSVYYTRHICLLRWLSFGPVKITFKPIFRNADT